MRQPANLCAGAKSASVSVVADDDEPICITLNNSTGKDREFRIIREPGNDSTVTVFGRPGETVTKVMLYTAPPGKTSVAVQCAETGAQLTSRTVNL